MNESKEVLPLLKNVRGTEEQVGGVHYRTFLLFIWTLLPPLTWFRSAPLAYAA